MISTIVIYIYIYIFAGFNVKFNKQNTRVNRRTSTITTTTTPASLASIPDDDDRQLFTVRSSSTVASGRRGKIYSTNGPADTLTRHLLPHTFSRLRAQKPSSSITFPCPVVSFLSVFRRHHVHFR